MKPLGTSFSQNVTTAEVAKLKQQIASLQNVLQKSYLLQGSFRKKVLNRASTLQTLHKELETVFELSNSIISFPNIEEILQLITRLVASVMDVKACSLRLFDTQQKMLVPGAHYGLSNDYLTKTPLGIGEGVPGLAVKLQKAVVVDDVLHDRRVRYPEELAQEGFRAVMAVPILFYEEILGTLAIYSERPRLFTSNEKSLLCLFASQAALAIKNARLNEETQLNYLNTINAFVLAMEARHPYTRGHGERVTRYALAIGRHIPLSEGDLGMIRWLGKLHDLGKIGVADYILDKPGKLTVAERAQIELHPSRGAEMLEPLTFVRKGLSILKNHHERYDGSGYPDGFVGEKIPLVARVVSVADAFDAMTTDRSYRKAMGLHEALAEIKKQRGSQFDPLCANIFLGIMKEEAA